MSQAVVCLGGTPNGSNFFGPRRTRETRPVQRPYLFNGGVVLQIIPCRRRPRLHGPMRRGRLRLALVEVIPLHFGCGIGQIASSLGGAASILGNSREPDARLLDQRETEDHRRSHFRADDRRLAGRGRADVAGDAIRECSREREWRRNFVLARRTTGRAGAWPRDNKKARPGAGPDGLPWSQLPDISSRKLGWI